MSTPTEIETAPPGSDDRATDDTGERDGAARPTLAHVLWIGESADYQGGCERYMAETAALLAARGVRSTLLYDPELPSSSDYLARFDAAFPAVDVAAQVADIRPDVVYVQRLSGAERIDALADVDVPVARFFHDHRLFCLREHKYTTLGRRTCTETTGTGCYACLGMIGRSPEWPGVRIKTLGSLEREQAANRRLDAFVVGSHYMADHVAAHGFDADRVHVNPLFAERPADAPDVERRTDRLLFVGQLVNGKGLDLLLHALSTLR